jgi:hypothetical protein
MERSTRPILGCGSGGDGTPGNRPIGFTLLRHAAVDDARAVARERAAHEQAAGAGAQART